MNSMTTDGYINCLTDNTNNKLLTEVIECESDNKRREVIENNENFMEKLEMGYGNVNNDDSIYELIHIENLHLFHFSNNVNEDDTVTPYLFVNDRTSIIIINLSIFVLLFFSII